MMIIKRLAMALTFLGCIGAYAVSPPTPSYSVTDIGVLPGFDECRGNAIDASGNVVGYCFKFGSAAVQHAFVYRAGNSSISVRFSTLPSPPRRSTQISGATSS